MLFKTKTFHPNINEQGQVCLPIITPENWKPATKTTQVLLALKSLLEEPEPNGALRGDVGDLFTKDREKYDSTVQDYVEKFAEVV